MRSDLFERISVQTARARPKVASAYFDDHDVGCEHPSNAAYPRGASLTRVQSSPPQNNPPKTHPSTRSTSVLFSEIFDE
jgi:hypothetical protein